MIGGGDFFNHIVALDEVNLTNPKLRDLQWAVDNSQLYFEIDIPSMPWSIVVTKTYTPQEVIEKIWKIYENRHNS